VYDLHQRCVFTSEMRNRLRLRYRLPIVIVIDYDKQFKKKTIVRQNNNNEKDLLESKINLRIKITNVI